MDKRWRERLQKNRKLISHLSIVMLFALLSLTYQNCAQEEKSFDKGALGISSQSPQAPLSTEQQPVVTTPGEAEVIQPKDDVVVIQPSPTPVPSVISVAADETSAGMPAVFTVSLDKPSAIDVLFCWQTTNSTAVAGSHYTTTSSCAAIVTGQTSALVEVPTLSPGESVNGVKTFNLALSNVAGALVGTGTTTGTIRQPVITPAQLPMDIFGYLFVLDFNFNINFAFGGIGEKFSLCPGVTQSGGCTVPAPGSYTNYSAETVTGITSGRRSLEIAAAPGTSCRWENSPPDNVTISTVSFSANMGYAADQITLNDSIGAYGGVTVGTTYQAMALEQAPFGTSPPLYVGGPLQPKHGGHLSGANPKMHCVVDIENGRFEVFAGNGQLIARYKANSNFVGQTFYPMISAYGLTSNNLPAFNTMAAIPAAN